MKIAVYPGTFDPVTNGHIDLIRRARAVFRQVVVGVAENPGKGTLFSVEDRVAMLKEATRRLAGIRVEPFGGLAVSFARRQKAPVAIPTYARVDPQPATQEVERGLRTTLLNAAKDRAEGEPPCNDGWLNRLAKGNLKHKGDFEHPRDRPP